MWALVLSTVGGAVLSAFLYPLVMYLLRMIRSRDSRRRLFQSSEKLFIVPSYVFGDGRASVRDADYRVASAISRFTATEDSDDKLPFSFTHPAFSLVILGSTRYNRLAVALQQTFHLPFQFVESRHSSDPSQRRMSVLTEFGEELISSRDKSSMPASVEVDYGIFLVATLRNGKRLFWIAGVHSAGTDGIWQYVTENSSKVLGWLPSKQDEFTALLIRVRFEVVSERENSRTVIQSVEALGPPRRAHLKLRTDSTPRALLCDLGNVLMDFDRTRTYRAIAHYASRSWGEVRDRLEEDGTRLRDRYECGELDTERFCDEIYSVLELDDRTLPRSLLKEFWSDIFWLNKEMAEALSFLHKNGTCLVLLSNTNPLHFEGVLRDYPDVFKFFSARVLSYEVGSTKPGPTIFEKAIEAVRSRVPACPTAQMLIVDDTAENVEAAKGFGMKALMYQSYSHFIWWARAEGLYIP